LLSIPALIKSLDQEIDWGFFICRILLFKGVLLELIWLNINGVTTK